MTSAITMGVDEVVIHLEEHFDRNDRRYLRGMADQEATIRMDQVKFLIFHPDDRDPILKICDRSADPDRRRRRRRRDEEAGPAEHGIEDGGDYFEGAGDDNGNR